MRQMTEYEIGLLLWALTDAERKLVFRCALSPYAPSICCPEAGLLDDEDLYVNETTTRTIAKLCIRLGERLLEKVEQEERAQKRLPPKGR